jgi:uroporphyrinogen decarboxylase
MTRRELFLANLRGEYTTRTPVWLMRQAGRYMKEYREIREKYSFEKICKTPKIAADVTMQPIKAFGPDAAIIFSDILFVVESFGFDLSYKPAPVITPLLESPDQVSNFVSYDVRDRLSFVSEAIVECRRRLGVDYPLIGFCGAPFTVFCFLCGVRGMKEFHKPYKFIIQNPVESGVILDILADISLEYLKIQIDSGVDYVQLFDTFAGELSAEEFEAWSLPYLNRIVNGLNDHNAYTGLYIRNSNHLLKSLRQLSVDSVCIDWKTPLNKAAEILAPKTLQGNLNPYLMLGSQDHILQNADTLMKSIEKYPGYIFNLGHGVLPDTPVENVRALVEAVHAFERNIGD